MDPLRSDTRPAETLTDVERDARIEQLLLSGLDEYFAQRYEHAINLWTRVLFFDRHHDRARAYIERARQAQAERQRESDAVLHQAIETFSAGDVTGARQLIVDAMERGASPDDAHEVMERIERLRPAAAPAKKRRRPTVNVSSAALSSPSVPDDDARPSRASGWLAALLLAAAAIGVLAVATWGITVPEPARWAIFASDPNPPADVMRWTPEPLPVAAASEVHLARARAFVATGRLHDALAALERIPIGDSLYRDATRLRLEVQQRLLTLAILDQAPSPTAKGLP
jgi:hypothetical protein